MAVFFILRFLDATLEISLGSPKVAFFGKIRGEIFLPYFYDMDGYILRRSVSELSVTDHVLNPKP